MSGELDSTGLLEGTSECCKSTKTAGILRFPPRFPLSPGGSGEKRLVFELECGARERGAKLKIAVYGMFLFRSFSFLFLSASWIGWRPCMPGIRTGNLIFGYFATLEAERTRGAFRYHIRSHTLMHVARRPLSPELNLP